MVGDTKLRLEGETLLVRRTFSAPREKVFRAWTDPAAFRTWFGPEGVSVLAVEVDLRVGGDYRVAMKSADGKAIHHHGTYREIRPPETLVFTWVLDDQPCDGSANQNCETLVTVEFCDRGTATEVVPTPELLPSETARRGHDFGWNGSFDCLARFPS